MKEEETAYHKKTLACDIEYF